MQTNFVQGKITFVPCFSPMVWINNQFFPHGMNQQSIPLWFWNTSNTSYKYEQDMVARISDYEYRKCSSLEVLERPMKRKWLYFSAKIILRRGRFWNFPNEFSGQKIDTKFTSLVSLSTPPSFFNANALLRRGGVWKPKSKFHLSTDGSLLSTPQFEWCLSQTPLKNNVVFDWKTTFSLFKHQVFLWIFA